MVADLRAGSVLNGRMHATTNHKTTNVADIASDVRATTAIVTWEAPKIPRAIIPYRRRCHRILYPAKAPTSGVHRTGAHRTHARPTARSTHTLWMHFRLPSLMITCIIICHGTPATCQPPWKIVLSSETMSCRISPLYPCRTTSLACRVSYRLSDRAPSNRVSLESVPRQCRAGPAHNRTLARKL